MELKENDIYYSEFQGNWFILKYLYKTPRVPRAKDLAGQYWDTKKGEFKYCFKVLSSAEKIVTDAVLLIEKEFEEFKLRRLPKEDLLLYISGKYISSEFEKIIRGNYEMCRLS